MKTVGITTTTYGNNFGEALQAYAMRKAINTYVSDCKAEVIDFIYKSQTSLCKPGFEDFEDDLIAKNTLFDEFRKNEIGLSGNPLLSLSVENAPVFDKYVFGSDQIWNTNAWKIPEFFGSFVPEGKSKVAYAASVGLKPDSPLLDCELFEKYIGSFDHIAVREKIHCKFVEQFTDKTVHHVADPTLLLDRSVYQELLNKAELTFPERDYVFYYQPHSADGAIVNLVNKTARLHHMDVVHTFANIPKQIFPYDSLSARFAGPREFLAYISNASLVITRSFHAMVFSILFERPFYVYVDKKTGSRFESLLETLGLEDRLIYDYIRPEDVSLHIDYSEVNKKLSQFKDSSIHYLINALS